MARKRYTADKRKDDRFGHIREIWDTFNHNCRKLCEIGAHATIDEMFQKAVKLKQSNFIIKPRLVLML